MIAIYIILALVGGFAAGFIVFHFFNRDKVILSESDQEKLSGFDQVNIDLAKAKTKIESFEEQLAVKNTELDKQNNKIEDLVKQINAYELAKASLEAQRITLEQKVQEQQKFITGAQESLLAEFKNISNEHLKNSKDEFESASLAKIGNILQPLATDIEKFKKEFTEKHDKEAKERFSLTKEIEKIVEVNNKMNASAENLANALKGDRKIQGNWGELVLERLLEDSGLKKGVHYKVQQSFANEDNKRQIPDFILQLPEGKHIIVDSKVSLVSYERYFSSESEADKDIHAESFVESVKAHIKNLSSKGYQDHKDINTLDFVIMFMPIEGSFQLASLHHPEILSYAWSNRVAITSPATLFPILNTINSIWKVEKQNKNTAEIIRVATNLYDKFINFGHDLVNVGNSISNAERSYKEAMSKLKDGRGNIVSTIDSLKELGIDKKRGNKKLPSFMQNLEEGEADEGDVSLSEHDEPKITLIKQSG